MDGPERRIVAGLAAAADAERGAGQRAYLKLERPCLGVRVPEVRRIVRRELDPATALDGDGVRATAVALWAGVPFEHRQAAVEVLARTVRVLGPADLGWLRGWIAEAETWALVDPLSTEVVAAIVEADPVAVGPTLDDWSVDPTVWVRRASMLSLLPALRRGAGDWDRFCRYADAMLGEREFFVRKAIGWVLRDTSRRRPELVAEWVVPRLDRMSGVTRREAVKYLPGTGRP